MTVDVCETVLGCRIVCVIDTVCVCMSVTVWAMVTGLPLTVTILFLTRMTGTTFVVLVVIIRVPPGVVIVSELVTS